MLKHTHTEPASVNFLKLEERILGVNNSQNGKYEKMCRMICDIVSDGKPTLIMATGGSKVVAYYLQSILGFKGLGVTPTLVIEPRSFFYLRDIQSYGNLVVISNSGKTNGVMAALEKFKGNKYLICQNENNIDNCKVIAWGTDDYTSEKSFISLASTLAPMSLILDVCKNGIQQPISPDVITNVNSIISNFIKDSNESINCLSFDFKNIDKIQIISGRDTKTPEHALESTVLESGLCVPTVSDKGSFCHGRNNIIFRYPEMPIIYLKSNETKLDSTILGLLYEEYPNVFVFGDKLLNFDEYEKEYLLTIQMYFLAKKIADDKNLDLTMPEYNPKLVRTLYNYKGEM